jgi:GntR family histidine utilization transcriptional repressor
VPRPRPTLLPATVLPADARSGAPARVPAAAPADSGPPSRPQAPYARVKRALKEALAAGQYPAGSQMPSEAELVARFGVSRMTVNRALRELQAEGLVERVQGVGTFAARLGRVSATLTLRDLHEEIVARGHQHHATVHHRKAERAPANVADALGLPRGARAFHTVIVHHENGVPLQCEDRWVNPAVAPGYLDADFTRQTPTHVLFQMTELWRAQYTIEAARPTATEARLLDVPADEPCLVIHRRTASREAAITTARLVQPGSRYTLAGEFSP